MFVLFLRTNGNLKYEVYEETSLITLNGNEDQLSNVDCTVISCSLKKNKN